MHAARTAAAAGRADGSGKRESLEVNKRIFDALHTKKEQVEAVFGAPLEWLRMDDPRPAPSPIASPLVVATMKAALRTWCLQKGFDGAINLNGEQSEVVVCRPASDLEIVQNVKIWP